MKNAPTPWQNAPAYVVDATGLPVAEVEFFGDYERDEQIRNRIVACVNACAGMDDPQKEIAALREALIICSKSLATYGSHPIIENQVRLALEGGRP